MQVLSEEFTRYLRHLFYRTPPDDYFCSTKKYFTNKLEKPLRKNNKKWERLVRKQQNAHSERNLALITSSLHILLLFENFFILLFSASHDTLKVNLDETNIDTVRGTYLTKKLQPVRQQEELVGAMLLSSSKTNGSS